MKKILLLMFVSFFALLHAKELLSERTLIEGQLANGFKYTIKKNQKPENMASFRLVVRIGSLEEDDDQMGIAHLLEHLAFNGTKHFKGNSLVKSLESLGVDFGSHLNASTSFAQTIYQLQIPLKNDNLEKTMLIFSDWADGIELTQKELDKERGVVLEEQRARNTSSYRIYEQMHKVFYKDSRYENRMPIGEEKIIKNISLKRVKDFYDEWYEPRFMNFIAIGDFDEKQMEQIIKKTFSSLKNIKDKKRYDRDAKSLKNVNFKIFKDKELTQKSLHVSFIKPYLHVKSEDEYKKSLIEDIAYKLFNLKAKELELLKNPYAKSLVLNEHLIGDNLNSITFSANFVKNDAINAYKQVLNLIYSVKENGFSKKDLQTVKKDILATNEYELKNLKNKTSSSYANELAYYKAYEEIYVDKKYAKNLEEKLLKQISLEDVNKAYKDIFSSYSRLIYFVLPEEYKINMDEIKNAYKKRKEGIKKEQKKAALPESIKVGELKKAEIISERFDKKHRFYEFILKNGVKVVYRYNDYEKDKIYLKALAKGGFSTYEDDKLPSAKKGINVINNSGLDKYDPLELRKIYADKIVSFNAFLNRFSRGFVGSSSKKDFGELLKGVYLLANKYKLNENILYNYKSKLKEQIKKRSNSPKKEFMKEYQKFYYKNNPRLIPLELSDVEKIKKDEILNIYKDVFGDFSTFTFFILGDVDINEVKKYASLYLGNLPTLKENKVYKQKEFLHVKGKNEFIKNLNNENISNIFLSYEKKADYSLTEAVRLKALKDVLSVKLRELIREEKSGVYGVGVSAYFKRLPVSEVYVKIHFSCEPKRKDELVSYVKKVVAQIQNKEVEQKYIDSFIKKAIVSLDEGKNYNAFWLKQFENHLMFDEGIKDAKEYENLYKSISPKILQETAKKYLHVEDIIYAELNPKEDKKSK